MNCRQTSRCLLTLVLSATLPGCTGRLGTGVVRAPNHGREVAQLDDHTAEPAMDGTVIDHRFRVEVESPPASLSVWIIDPSGETLRTEGDDIRFDDPPPQREVRPPEATVLLLHGFHHDKNHRAYLVWARFLAQHGYRAVLVDLRGQGGSSGAWLTFGPQEARDVRHVIDELDRRRLLVGQLGVLGASYGGATAIHLAGLDPRVACVATVSAFSTMRGVIPAFSRGLLGPLHGLVGVWGYDRIVDAAGSAGGFDPDQSDARLAIVRTEAPVLIMHSSNDRHVPPQNARDLAEAGGVGVKLLLFDGPGHFGFGMKDANAVRGAMLEWFDEHLK